MLSQRGRNTYVLAWQKYGDDFDDSTFVVFPFGGDVRAFISVYPKSFID